MKFSLNLAQYYSTIDYKSIPKDTLIEKLGLQLGAIEAVKDYSPRYKDIVVVRVVSCEKHPNADKLSLCRVDDGGVTQDVERDENGHVQVVCGAPNVHADMWAVWIPPRARVPSTLDTDPFVLEARELRGKASNGMVASCQELDISDNHDGILEVNPVEVGREPQAGEPIINFYGLDDFIIDCENKMFTHRPDCFGNFGIAREVAGIFGQKYEDPEWYWKKPLLEESSKYELNVQNQIPELVPRFMTVIMENVTVAQSPVWMQAALKRVGIKPINNVVDISNFVMHLSGQPTHAFDFDKLLKEAGVADQQQLEFGPRKAKNGEKLKLLSGKIIELTDNDMVISAGDTPVALAGVMGGSDTEVDENTKTVVIECATFDMYAIRRTSMRHGLFTDAVTRYNKGQSALQNDRVIWYVMKNMAEYAGATQASNVYDLRSESMATPYYDQSYSGESLTTTTNFINSRLGSGLSEEEVCQSLRNVGFAVFRDNPNSDVLTFCSPFWRMDISIPEDIVEEVGRLYGYGNVLIELPARSSKAASKNARLEFAQHLRSSLKEAGANEVLTYSFVHGDLLKNTGTDPQQWAYHLRNAINPDLQYYRTSLLPSMLAKVHGNIKAQAGSDDNEFALFEIGKAHIKGEFELEEPQLPKQMRRLSLVFAADNKTATKYSGSPYYQAKNYLDILTDGQASYLPLDTNEYPIAAPFLQGRAAIVSVNSQMLGVIGEFTHKVRTSLKLPEFCAGFEIDIDLLREHVALNKYQPLSAFPSTHQDITLEVNKEVVWGDIEGLLHAELAVSKAELGYMYQLEPVDIFQPKDTEKKRVSFRINLTHNEKTLKTEEVSRLLDNLAKAADENIGAIKV